MLRGDFRLPFTVFIVIMAFLGVFFAGVLFLKGIGDSAKVTATTMGYLNTVDAAHFVEECLSEGKDYISAGFLDSSTGNIADVCMSRFPMLSEVSARAKVVDLEREVSGESKTWLFGWSGGSGDPSHQIYVSILEDDDIHIGRLYVQTKA